MAGNTVYVQGSYIDVHDNEVVNLSIDKATVRVDENDNDNDNENDNENENENGNRDITVRDSQEVPPILLSQKATELMGRLVAEGLIDEAWQPVGLSRPQAAMLADRVAEVLGIKNKWKVFEQLWNKKNLRNDYNTALNECAYFDDYRKKFEKIMR